jgi:cytokinin dehydrogenase
MDIRKLRELISGQVLDDEDILNELSTDFGRLVHRKPAVIVAPANSEDVQRIVEAANLEGWQITIRGAGHSQSGQSLSHEGILLDVAELNTIEEPAEDTVWVGSGVVWKDLVDALIPRGLIPPVLTNNLNVTVGGTISTAGLGVSSYRYGIQAENVEALEVVTGTGDLVQCSATENHELFDCTRCGLGQFSIITRVKLKLRDFSRHVRTYFLLYDNLAALMLDQATIMSERRFDFLEGWCTPCDQGLRRLAETRVPFAEWFFPLHLTVEYGGEPLLDTMLSDLNFYRHVYTEDSTLQDYTHRMESVVQVWRENGTWVLPHPWMEVVLPWDRAEEYITGVLKSFPPNLISGGQIALWPCTGFSSKVPMYMCPHGEFVMGFGIMPAVPRGQLGITISLLNKASDLAIQVGGKRYLSGWIEFDHERWKEHFGELWPLVVQWKGFFDPNHILNPGFIDYDPDA